MPGIGPKKKQALLKAFGSLKAIKEATADELGNVPGISPALVEQIKATL